MLYIWPGDGGPYRTPESNAIGDVGQDSFEEVDLNADQAVRPARSPRCSPTGRTAPARSPGGYAVSLDGPVYRLRAAGA